MTGSLASLANECGDCGGRAAVECVDCRELYCYTCDANMHRKGRRKTHVRKKLDPDVPTPPRHKPVVYTFDPCPFHKGQYCDLYCKECRVLVCAHCLLVGDHPRHEHEPAGTLFQKEISRLREKTHELERHDRYLAAHIEQLGHISNDVNRQAQAVDSDLHNHHDLAQRNIDSREREIQQLIQLEEGAFTKDLVRQETIIGEQLKRMDNIIRVAGHLLQERDGEKFLHDTLLCERALEVLTMHTTEYDVGRFQDILRSPGAVSSPHIRAKFDSTAKAARLLAQLDAEVENAVTPVGPDGERQVKKKVKRRLVKKTPSKKQAEQGAVGALMSRVMEQAYWQGRDKDAIPADGIVLPGLSPNPSEARTPLSVARSGRVVMQSGEKKGTSPSKSPAWSNTW